MIALGRLDLAPDSFTLLAIQSTLILVAAWIADWLLAGRSARGHFAMTVAIAACFVAPVATLGARRLGLGLFAVPGPPSVQATEPGAAGKRPIQPRGELRSTPHLDRASSRESFDRAVIPPPELKPGVRSVGTGPSLKSGLLIAWALASGVGLLRLVGSFVAGGRLVARSRPLLEPGLWATVAGAIDQCRLLGPPEVRVSPEVPCPVIWCWGRRPTLVLPRSLERPPTNPAPLSQPVLAAVVGHELAHWERRDHWATLLGELLVCAIPWQPLAWWACRRRASLAELACDDRVRAWAGPEVIADYAEALLGWAADRRRPLFLAAVSRRSGLAGRVRHLLDGAAPMPHPGRSWTTCALATAAGLVALLALAQPRPQSARATTAEPTSSTPTLSPEETMADVPAPPVMIEGSVVTPAGVPIAGVEVLCRGFDVPFHPPAGRFDPAGERPPARTLGRGTTDAAGRFTLRVPPLVPQRNEGLAQILAYRPGLAPASGVVWPDNRPVRIVLDAPVPIRGQLLRPDGTPAAGVPVRLERYTNNVADDNLLARDCSFPSLNPRAERPAFLANDFRTDADGRFAIDGLVPTGMFASLSVAAAEFAAEELTVSTRADPKLVPAFVALEITPLPSDFTHTLRPARPVVGTIRDESTGQPLAGLTVEVIPMGRHGGMQVRTTTDAEGRFRVADREGETYSVTAYPAPGSGLVAEHRGMLPWPDGANELRVDLSLRRGVTIRGRVVDEVTGRPITGAAVTYRPTEKNPQGRNQDEYRVTARTDGNGQFTITGLPGAGVVGVDGPDEGFIRRPLGDLAIRGDEHAQPHGFARVDIADPAAVPEVVVRLRRGITLEALATLPDGSSPEYVQAWCPELSSHLLDSQFNAVAFLGGRFRFPGAEPGRVYRVIFLSDHARFGAVAELRADPAVTQPIAVRLAPTATVAGRLVNAAGQPLQRVPVYAHLDHAGRGDRLTRADLYDEILLPLQLNLTQGFGETEPTPDFRLDGLIPGLGYVLTWADGNPAHEQHRVVAPLAPGEVRSLGDLHPGPALDTNR